MVRNVKRVISIILIICLIASFSITGAFAAGEDYRGWVQSDSRWGSLPVGSSGSTVASIGCCVTSVTKLIIQAGLRNSDDFNIGTLVRWLNNNGGFTSDGGLYWGKPGECVSGWSNYGDVLGYGSYSASGYNDQIIAWIRKGLHMTVNVNGGSHWVAVDEAKSLATGEVYIMDSLGGAQNTDLTLASRYASFNAIHAYTGGSTPSGGTVPGKPMLLGMKSAYDYRETIIFKWENTESTTHYNLYIDRKQDDGSYTTDYKVYHYVASGQSVTLPIGEYRVLLQSTNSNAPGQGGTGWAYTNASYVYFTVSNLAAPGKPALIEMSGEYDYRENIVFKWNDTVNTTHYNLYIDKKQDDGSYQVDYKVNHYAESGIVLTLPKGEYRVLLQSTNSEYRTDDNSTWRYTNSDYVNFIVKNLADPGKPALLCLSAKYHKMVPILLCWDETINTTHYNIYLDKMNNDGTYQRAQTIHYAENNSTLSLEEGKYRICLQSTNSNYRTDDGNAWRYTDGDWQYFEVSTDNHIWDAGVVTREATERENGICTYTCTLCGDTKEEIIPALPHKHSYDAVVIAPTCTTKGYTTHTCACGDSYVDTYTNALGHAWDSGTVTKEPTATETGIRTYACTRCGETKMESIPVVSVDVTQMFTDVTKNWAYPGIQYCVTHGIMGGMGDGTFAPTGTTTRAQIVQILYNLEGTPAVSGTTPFTDLTANWYKPAILWAYQNNVVAGTSPTTFDPEGPVTREQIAVILTQYMFNVLKMNRTWTPADLSTFPDGANVSGWAKEAMQDAVALGLINGTKAPDGLVYLDPQGSATRQQVATILMNFCQNVKK